MRFGAKATKLSQVTELTSQFCISRLDVAFHALFCVFRAPELQWVASPWVTHCSSVGNTYQVAIGSFFPASTYLLKCQAALSFIFLTLSIVRVSAVCCLALVGIRNSCCHCCHQPYCKSFSRWLELPLCFSSLSLTAPVGCLLPLEISV